MPDMQSIAAERAVLEMIDLQRQIYLRQNRAIESAEEHQTRGFKKYKKEYEKAVSNYILESGFGALCDAIVRSRVAFIADYHTLALVQKTFVKIVRSVLQQTNNICLAMEFIPSKAQKDLNFFLQEKIKEKTFLRRIDYLNQWPYDIWPNFKPIFSLAKENGIPIIGIDSSSSKSLKIRDRHSAKIIADTAMEYYDSTIIVFAGQMHISPSHLPESVDSAFVKKGLQAPGRVIVYQNTPEIYWQLAHARREDVEVVKIDEESYCVNNTPPLVAQLSYIHWINYDTELLEYGEMEDTVHSLMKDLSEFFEFDIKNQIYEVRVLAPGDLDLMDILEKNNLSKEERNCVLEQVSLENSSCIPKAKLIYLATLSINHAAEEAAHYVKNIVSNPSAPDDFKDRFYFTVINEALGFFASKIINPKRKAHHRGKLRKLRAMGQSNKKTPRVEEKAADFALKHLALNRGKRKMSAKTVRLISNPKVYYAAAHFLGYILGDKLYYAYTSGMIKKQVIRKLFLDPMDKPGYALMKYLELCEETIKVKIPRRI